VGLRGGRRLQPALSPGGAGGDQHRVGRRQVVVAAFHDEHQHQGDGEHPSDHPKALRFRPGEEPEESGEPERGGDDVSAFPELADEKAAGAAEADVPGVNARQELERQEVVAELPDEVGQEDEERNCGAQPEPRGGEVLAGTGEQDAAGDAGQEERQGELGHQAEAHGHAQNEEPARLVRLE
jgi:hypothetical protein